MYKSNHLDDMARKVIQGNDKGGYTIPTKGLYPYQWNWDSAFAAYGFSEFDIPRAWQEIETLFDGQWNNGMLPHIIFHKIDESYFPGPKIWQGIGPIASSGISQPPVVASIVRKILEKDSILGFKPAKKLYKKLLEWHRWFIKWRSEDGMIYTTHPWEAGRDNAPDWDMALAKIDPAGIPAYQRRDTSHVDPKMRPTKYDYDRYVWLLKQGQNCSWDEKILKNTRSFCVADPTLSFILLRANRDLRELGLSLGSDVSEIDGWISIQERASQKLWNPQLASYDSYDIRNHKHTGSISNASFLCWYAGLKDDRMLTQFDRIMKQVKYGMPSHDPESKHFDRMRYWRGPSWAIMNMMIGIGLEEMGEIDRANLIKSQTHLAISEKGFAEYFDPMDGTPAGGETFTWTAAVWLTWAKH
jgi:hypothetical protein